MAHYPIMSIEQNNPGIWRTHQWADITGKNIENIARPRTLQAALEHQKLVNQYYGPNIESEIGLRGAQGNYLGQQAQWYGPNIASEIALRGMQGGHLGAQTAGLHMENQRQKQLYDLQNEIASMESGQTGNVIPSQGSIPVQTLGDLTTQRIPATATNINYNVPQQPLQQQPSMGAISLPQPNREITEGDLNAVINDIKQKNPQANAELRRLHPYQPSPTTLNEAQAAPQQMPIAPLSSSVPEQPFGMSLLEMKRQQLARLQGTQGLGTKAAQSLSVAEKKEDNKEYNKALDTANISAKGANEVNKYLEQFERAYKQLGSQQKGVLAGRVPAVTSEAQKADTAAQNIQAGLMVLFKGGRITEKQLEFLGRLKPNRAMNPEAVKSVSDALKAHSTRLAEEQPFLNAAKAKGISAQEAKTLWNMYDVERPAYDYENEKPINENLHSFKEYLTPASLQAANSGEPYAPSTKTAIKNTENNIQDERMLNGQKYIKVNGEWHQA
jgi:hypothetical protein